jgi:hypothetical protein
MAFTQQQLSAAAELPNVIIQGMITVDGTTYGSVVREFVALGKFIDEAQVAYANNLLVQSALLRFIDEEGNIQTGLDAERIEHIPPDQVLEGVDIVMEVLAGLPETPGYKQFIFTLAERIAGAAGGGLFGSGNRISQEEAALLEALRVRLTA